MSNAWGLTAGVSIQKLGEDRMLFRFEHVVEKKCTMWRSPWAFDRNLVILREFQKNEDPMEVNLNLCNFFIQVSGLSPTTVTRVLAKAVGDAIGTFIDIDVEDHQEILSTSMRLRICIDITKPLMHCVSIEGPKKQLIQLRLAYEKLPNFCYYCGTLGHLVKDCNECLHLVMEMDTFNADKLEYGDWLRAQLVV